MMKLWKCNATIWTEEAEKRGAKSKKKLPGRIRIGRCLTAFIAVHPHARGDDATIGEPFWSTPGSPPRAWGR